MKPSGTPFNPDDMPIDDAVAFWLVQQDQGMVLDDDPRFLTWLSASSGNLQAWDRAQILWQGFENNSDPLLEAMRHDALAARRTSGKALTLGAIAASVAVMLVAGAVVWRIYGIGPQPGMTGPIVPPDARPTFVADGTGPATFALPDGSRVTLNANTAIAVRYGAQRRAVRLLRGQAFFQVIHDSARPFTTDASESVISDLGTDFDVLMRGHSLLVTLVSGSIAVATKVGGGQDTLKPGQRLEVAPGQPGRIMEADLEDVAAWRTAYIEFHDEPLEQAVAQVNRYGGAPVRIADRSIRGMRVSGRFRTGDPSRFARTLAEIYPLRIINRPDGGVDITKR
jgi:transmembrane sensor